MAKVLLEAISHSIPSRERRFWRVAGWWLASDVQVTHRTLIKKAHCYGVYALTVERWWETTAQNRVDISIVWCQMNRTIPTWQHLSVRLFYKLHRNTSVPKAWDTELNRREALISDLVYGNFFSKLVSKALGSGKNGGCRWVSQLSLLLDFLGSLLCPRAIRISKRGTQWADFSTCHSFETH